MLPSQRRIILDSSAYYLTPTASKKLLGYHFRNNWHFLCYGCLIYPHAIGFKIGHGKLNV